jgi:hypothetical protein
MRRAICRLLWLALGISATGCTSIYHRTRTELPPEPTAELNLRVAEATQAEREVRAAGARLLQTLRRQKPRALAETEFDRLETAAFDLERRAWAARDAAERCGNPEAFAGEIERLRQQSDAWLGYIRANRSAAPATQLEQLEDRLR